VDVTAADPQSYPLTIYLDINGSLYSCSGTTCSVPIGDGTGTASFLAQATGGGNLISGISSVTFQVDTQAPTLGVSAPPVDGLNGWYISAPITVTGTASDSVSGVAWIDINGGGSGYTASADGVYTLSVSAGDAAGNTTSGTAYLQIDTTPPGVGFIMPTPNGANGWYRSPITISPSSSDAMSGISDQVVSLDGITWFSSTGINSDGTYTVFAAALDLAGNSASTSTSVQYDSTAPDLVVTLPPPNGSGWYTAAPVTITASAGDATSGLGSDAVQYSIDGGAWQAGTSAEITSEGTHSVAFQATDIAGNVASETYTLNIDTQGALLSLSGNGVFCPACGETLAITYSVQDGGSGIEYWQLSADSLSLANGTAEANSVLTWDGSGLSVGVHTITLQAEDLAGNTVQTSLNVILQAAPVTATGTPITGGPGVITSATHTRTPTSTSTHAATRTPQPTSGSGTGGTVEDGNGSSSGISSTNTSPASPVLPWAVAASAVAVTTAATAYTRKREGEEEKRNPNDLKDTYLQFSRDSKSQDLFDRRIASVSALSDSVLLMDDISTPRIDQFLQNIQRNNQLDSLFTTFHNGSFPSVQSNQLLSITSDYSDYDRRISLLYYYLNENNWDSQRVNRYYDEILAPRIVSLVNSSSEDVVARRALINRVIGDYQEIQTSLSTNSINPISANTSLPTETLPNSRLATTLSSVGSHIPGGISIISNLIYSFTGNQTAHTIGDVGTVIDSGIDISHLFQESASIGRNIVQTVNTSGRAIIPQGLTITTISQAARIAGGFNIFAGLISTGVGVSEIIRGNQSGDTDLRTVGYLDTFSGLFTTAAGVCMLIPLAQFAVPLLLAASGALTIASICVEHWDAISSWTINTAHSIGNWTHNVSDSVINWTSNTANAIESWGTNTAHAVNNWTQNTINRVANWAHDAANSVINWTSNTANAIGNWITNTAHSVNNWTHNAVNSVVDWTHNTVNTVENWVTNTVHSIGTTVSSASNSVVNWTTNTINSVSNWFSNLGNNNTNGNIREPNKPIVQSTSSNYKTPRELVSKTINQNKKHTNL
jgi:hypothetical protein